MRFLRRTLLLAAVFSFLFIFQSSAQATYSSGWNKRSYSSGYNVSHTSRYHYSNSSRYHGYRSSYRRGSYGRSSYGRTSYRWTKSRYKKYGWWKNRYHQPKPEDKKPVAVDDAYDLKAGDVLSQNIVNENDTQGDGQGTVKIVGGQLPSGIELASDGTLSGATDELGVFEVHYKLIDSDGDYSKAKVTIGVTQDIAYCPQAAGVDEFGGGNYEHALWIPKISTDLKFIGTPISTRTLPSGDLIIVGVVADADHEFEVQMTFSDFHENSSDPKLELMQSAYVNNGGPIDPSTWDFWAHLEGSLVGTKGVWAGTRMTFEIRGAMGQLGFGANGKNQNFGFSSWFDLTIESTSSVLPEGFHIGQKLYGDINADLPDECPEVREVVLEQCALTAELDSFGQYGGGHSITLFGVSKFSFDPAAEVLVYNNGDVEISGAVYDANGQGFDASFVYTMNTDQGTPKLELIDAAYAAMGGPVDPSTWEYFAGFTGTLIGRDGDYSGVEISLEPRGPIAQLGLGANGKNVGNGLSNWLTATVVSGSDASGLHTGETYHGDINIDVKDSCDDDLPVQAFDNDYFLYPFQTIDVNILEGDVLGDPETTLTFDPATIPAGFSLSPDGQLTGFSTVGSVVFTFDYTITDADGDTDTATVTITLGLEPG